MKKLFLIFFLSMLCLYSKAWIDRGAVWHYEFISLFGPGFVKIEYTHDTIVQGKTCQVLRPTTYVFRSQGPGLPLVLFSINQQASEYTYQNGDTVFYYRSGAFQVLYNFGAQRGSSWDLGVDTNDLLCSRSLCNVIDTGSVFINGQFHRFIDLDPDPNSSVGLYGKAIERFGAAETYLFPLDRNCDSSIVVDWAYYSFSCYQDSSFSLYNVTANDCEYLLTIGIDEIKNRTEVRVFPNPSNQSFKLISTLSGKYHLSLFSPEGELILETSGVLNDHEINVQTLSAGIYFIRLRSENLREQTIRFVKY
ncbi:MAG: T9SS C-terminal target domain-containing protein [Bacteroidetes bacterium]|nr:MAG: T9SS C-terminal target domain-containing protein [Bacteroidota bacterium]REK00730.1 MAG: T9SS C-terminal target domain-containing protein [Bacteroidota bacterium]REK34978.1 MAG: T9SS C-terminal target domain-containing protein [Bacteroidota bacterium]REK48225.1 MAG: T9SS C-terminal target domain-containing protein [Bacteroidota bacterium]